jgi:hAT family protein
MVHAIEMGWFIINKYYEITDTVPAYTAAILLDPRNRAEYLRRNWPEKWVEPAIAHAIQLWVDEYKTEPVPASIDGTMEVDYSHLQEKEDPLGKYLNKLQVPQRPIGHGDDLEIFMNEECFSIGKNLTLLEWWSLLEQRERYPRLHRMAIDIFSIQPSSAEPERTFSGARRTQSWDRLRLTVENLERLECIGNWLRNGHIDMTHILTALQTMDEIEALVEDGLDEADSDE